MSLTSRWLRTIKQKWTAFANSKTGTRVLRGGRYLLIAGILGYLAYQLVGIGWREVLRSLPTTPWFYVTIGVMYAILPLAEVLIYGRAWGLSARESLPVLLRKRVLNTDVVGYSGEVYLFSWARQRAPEADTRSIALTIKDNLIISSIMSVGSAVLILVVLLATGYVTLDDVMKNPTPGYLAAGGAALALAIALIVQFRRSIFTLPRALILWMVGVHGGRFLLSNVLQVVQWWVVLPQAPFSAWATLLAVLIVTNRIPLLPSRDLFFAGAGIGMAAGLGIPAATMAGMLLVRSALDRILNTGLFGATLLWERYQETPELTQYMPPPPEHDPDALHTAWSETNADDSAHPNENS
ncbi:MAG: hypothetical protein R6U20_04275 [Longimonas sp.]|uniref:hypothetical protein n=1 Tax=Longimonas sp. TaxID=2039626 RepID=UPI003975FC7D